MSGCASLPWKDFVFPGKYYCLSVAAAVTSKCLPWLQWHSWSGVAWWMVILS